MTPVTVLVLDVPLDPSRDEARDWAVDELSRREYEQARPGFVQSLVEWLVGRVSTLFDQVPDLSSPRSAIVLGVVLAVVAGVVWYAVWRFGGPGGLRTARQADPVFDDVAVMSAEEHRALATQAERDGDWDTAVVERFRGLVKGLEERTVLTARPGRTADEAAGEAGTSLPDLAGRLGEAARVFDEVRYGGRPAGAQGAELLREVDAEVDRTIRAGGLALT